MRWTLLLLLLVGWAAAKPKGCDIAAFEYKARTIHNPSERHSFAIWWITHSQCTEEQLTWLWNNSPDLMGTADTPQWRYLLSKALEK
jgi:hypothetical protein